MGNSKITRCLLLKKYFDPSFRTGDKSLWNLLPHECKAIVRDFEREHFMAERIQNHWHKVRYAPGTCPAFADANYSFSYEVQENGRRVRKCSTRCQRTIIYWTAVRNAPRPIEIVWEPGHVARGPRKNTLYEAVLIGDYTTAETGKQIYYYDLEKRAARNFGYLVAVPQDPLHVVTIKPW